MVFTCEILFVPRCTSLIKMKEYFFLTFEEFNVIFLTLTFLALVKLYKTNINIKIKHIENISLVLLKNKKLKKSEMFTIQKLIKPTPKPSYTNILSGRKVIFVFKYNITKQYIIAVDAKVL